MTLNSLSSGFHLLNPGFIGDTATRSRAPSVYKVIDPIILTLTLGGGDLNCPSLVKETEAHEVRQFPRTLR